MGRGCSSAGRAPALQAGGRRFEPDHLHSRGPRFARTRSRRRVRARIPRRDGSGSRPPCFGAGSGYRQVRPRSSQWKSEFRRSGCCTPDRRRRFLWRCRVLSKVFDGVPVWRPLVWALFVLCQGESGSGASLGALPGEGWFRNHFFSEVAKSDRYVRLLLGGVAACDSSECVQRRWNMCVFGSGLAVRRGVGTICLGDRVGWCGWLLCMVGSRLAAMRVRFRAREGHSVDALAPGGDEGRGTLRKATGSREQALIRGYPNGATHPYGVSAAEYIGCRGKPGELKHLSTRRKRHQQRFR